mmetsp:Transcript_6192/g.15930  ORF Transcript_6192/g.15930 Transcript_6192/m.15930 type:complete len:430 (-) Transcript_6192:1112-2401(-)
MLEHILGEGEKPAVRHILRWTLGGGVKQERRAVLCTKVFRALGEEAKGVEPRQEEVLQILLNALFVEVKLLAVNHRRVHEVAPKCIRAVPRDDLQRVWVVLFPLRHLRAVFRQDEAIDNEVLERRLAKEGSPKHGERVEPTSCLVNTFCDEVGRERAIKALLLLVRVVSRGIGHRARLEPAVKHLRNAPQNTLPLLRRDSNVVNRFTMEVLDPHARQLLEVRNRLDAHALFVVITDPQRDWRAPETVPRDVPVASIHKPVLESLFLDRVRDPVRLVVGRHKLFPHVLDLNKPRLDGLTDESRARSPAEGVVVCEVALADKPPGRAKVLQNSRISVLVELAGVRTDGLKEAALVVDRARHIPGVNDALGLAHAEVIGTKGGGLVNDAHTRLVGHIVVINNAERALAKVLLKERKQRLIPLTDELFPEHRV